MIKATIEESKLYHYPDGYKKTCIQTSEGDRYYCDIPVNDAIELADIFEKTPHEKLNLTPEKFILKLSYRFYTEWCLEDELKRTYLDYKPKNHFLDYMGKGFSDFIEEESYLALERAIKSGLIKPPPSPRTGDEIRPKVLEGVVKRAIELFSDWGGENHPPDLFNKEIPDDKKDKRNLRCNLKEYIGF